MAKVTLHKEQTSYVEVGIIKYPGYLESSVLGLTELFTVANRFVTSDMNAQHPIIRVTHWEGSPRNPRHIQRTFDSHQGARHAAPRILIAPASLARPIAQEEAAPYAAWLNRLHAHGSILTSVCGGAFLLAEAKLLNGRSATTHWYYADALRERYPAVNVQVEKIVIDDGDIITAGGMTAWTNLGILLIHKLLGSAVTLETARFMLVDPSGREQSSYSHFSPRLDHGDGEILKVQHWLQKNACRNVNLAKMAKISGLEMRTFIRRFRKATALTPTEYCQQMRIEKAQEMLVLTNHSVERVSWTVGYEDPASFRRVFKKIVNLAPKEYRSLFQVRSLDKRQNHT